MPSGTVELVFNLCEDEVRIYSPEDGAPMRRFAGAVVSGTYPRAFLIDPSQHTAMLGVHFRPGGASTLLGLPAGELAGRHLDLSSLWGAAGRELHERLYEATNPYARFSILEEVLMARLRSARERSPAVTAALRLFGPAGNSISAREAADQVGLSQRRFIQVFGAEVGLTPKLFCRVLRFQHALSLVRTQAPTSVPAVNWAGLAAACGYCDQSHLIRDFVEFTGGLRPRDYLRQRSERVLRNHVPVPV